MTSKDKFNVISSFSLRTVFLDESVELGINYMKELNKIKDYKNEDITILTNYVENTLDDVLQDDVKDKLAPLTSSNTKRRWLSLPKIFTDIRKR